MKKLLMLLLCAAVAIGSLTACGKNKTEDDFDMDALREDMLNASELPEMLSADSSGDNAERKLASLTDIDYDKVADFFIEYAADGSSYEIAVIRLKSADDVKTVEKDLHSHIESRTEQYRYYQPDQAPRAESAIVVTADTCVALIMCDDPSAVKAAFEKAFS